MKTWRRVCIERLEDDVFWSFSVWQESNTNEPPIHLHQGRPSLDFEEAERESREWLRNNP